MIFISIILLGGMYGAFLYFKNKSAEAERKYFNTILKIKYLVYEITINVHDSIKSLKDLDNEILNIVLCIYILLKDDFDKKNITLKEVLNKLNNLKIEFIDKEVIESYGYSRGVFGIYKGAIHLISIATLTPKNIVNQTEEYRIKRVRNILKHELSHIILSLLYNSGESIDTVHHNVMKEKGFNC